MENYTSLIFNVPFFSPATDGVYCSSGDDLEAMMLLFNKMYLPEAIIRDPRDLLKRMIVIHLTLNKLLPYQDKGIRSFEVV